MAPKTGFVSAYSKATGKKHRIPAHYMDDPIQSTRFSLTPRQRDADAKTIATAGGSRADHPDEPTAAEATTAEAPTDPAPTPEADTSEPAGKPKRPSSTETPATRGEE